MDTSASLSFQTLTVWFHLVSTFKAVDSDEEIVMTRKPRSRKVLQDSDDDGEEVVSGMPEALVLEESSVDDSRSSENIQIKKKKMKRIAVDSDESEPEVGGLQSKPKEETKKRDKSQRRKEKGKRKAATVNQYKRKTNTVEVGHIWILNNVCKMESILNRVFFFRNRSLHHQSLSMTVAACWEIMIYLTLSWMVGLRKN